MTHADLVNLALKWCRGRQRCKFVYAELNTKRTKIIPDVLGWRPDGNTVLIECKTSRPDFFADQAKRHKGRHRGPGLYRWYFTDGHLVDTNEVPSGWGLAEVKGSRVYVKKEPVASKKDERSPTRRRDETLMLLAIIRRHELGVPWYADKGRFKAMRRRR